LIANCEGFINLKRKENNRSAFFKNTVQLNLFRQPLRISLKRETCDIIPIFDDITTFLWVQKPLICWRYQRFCKAFILVIFADSSKGVCPVISLQYLKI
jgi:hypothetical protein